ncbi:hypothetical protein [Treponema pedis]|uniref:hypothetical protein n=1 Tax=Treponema pedis TaxID=409322 RepID=UPI00041DB835|nr:hypothetical protein [Treponema pedis]
MIFFVLLFLANLFIYAGSYTDKLNIEHDLAYWINNSVSLKLGFPPENLFMAGTKLQYHYFSSVQIAFTSLIYDIDVYTLSVPFYVITKTVIMIGAVDFFLEIFKVDVKGKILGFIIILFTTGFENFSIVTYFSHILLLPFGFDIGFAYGILFLTLLYYQWLHEFNFKIFLLASLFWFVCIGAKAPVASILLLTTAFLCLNKLFEKKVVLPLVYGFSMLGIFIFISIYFVGLLSVAEATNGAYYIKFHTLSEMAITVKGIKIPLFLSIFLKLLSLNFFYFVMLGISFSLLVLFVRKKNISKNELYFILSMFYSHILGILLWIIIKADGKSEMYYAMGSFIPLYFIFVIIYNKGRLYISNNGKVILKKEYIYAIFSILVFFGVECFLFFPYGTNIFYITGRNIINFVQNNNSCNTIAFEWIRKNSKKTAIVVSDAVFVNNYSYVCGILTERQQYLESYHMLRFAGIDIQNEIKRRKRLIQNIFNNDVRALIELRSEIGAGNYIVQNVTVTPDFIYNEELLLPVFESDKFRVFKIK